MLHKAPLPGSRGIYVDVFTAECGVFFLTHAHADHMQGLHATWNRGLIHCSHLTAKFLTRRKACSSRILRPHALEEPFQVMDPLARGSSAQVTATFVDSCHCPGSVMVVVEGVGSNAAIINTGDMR